MLSVRPNMVPSNVVVIGCGGTGSRLVPMLAQFIRSITQESSPTGWLIKPVIRLVDDDVVEMKNTARQLFIESDVGKHKAVVLAQRYSAAFGVNISPTVARVKPGMHVQELFKNDPTFNIDTQDRYGANTLWILCVDTAQARRDILAMIANSGRGGLNIAQAPFIIDAGNEDTFGQVKFFNAVGLLPSSNYQKNMLPMCPEPGPMTMMPMPVQYYVDLVDMPGQGSCADLDQTLAINASMATTIMGVVQNYYYNRPFTFNEVGISLDGAGYTTHNTLNNIIDRAVRTPRATEVEMLAMGFLNYSNFGIDKYVTANRRKLDEIEQMRVAAELKAALPEMPADVVESPVEEARPATPKKIVDLPVMEAVQPPPAPPPAPVPEAPPLMRVETA